jgi:hypothetical protein
LLHALKLIRGIEVTVLDETVREPQDTTWADDLSDRIDVLWFSGWESAAHRFSAAEWTALAEAVVAGMGLVHTGGQACFHGGDGRGALLDCTALADALPVTLQPHDIVWHPRGVVQAATQKDRDFFGDLTKAPALPFSKTTAHSDAAIHALIDGFPLLVTGRHGKGRTAVFTQSLTKPLAVLSMTGLPPPDPPDIVPYWERRNLKENAHDYWSGLVQLAIGLLACASDRSCVASPEELADEYQRPLFEQLSHLPETTLAGRVEVFSDKNHKKALPVVRVTNTGRIVARLVRGRVVTSSTSDHRFLDGFFDLLPGEERTLRFEADCPIEQVALEISAQNAQGVSIDLNGLMTAG